MKKHIGLVGLSVGAVALIVSVACAAPAVAPAFSSAYTLADLGTAQNTPLSYGGILFAPGDSNRVLLGGNAASSDAGIYSVSAVRDLVNGKNRVTGFTGTASLVATATTNPGSGIDGGLLAAPNGTLLFTSYDDNAIGQIKPGSNAPDKRIFLDDFGISASVGSFQFIPAGFGANSGKLLIGSFNNDDLYTASLVPDGSGTYDLADVSPVGSLPGAGPEGFAYISGGNPFFPSPAVLVTEYARGEVAAYDVNAAGIPIVSTRRSFLTGLSQPVGATTDPETGDVLLSLGDAGTVLGIRGFAPVIIPETGTLFLLAPAVVLGVMATIVRRRAATAL